MTTRCRQRGFTLLEVLIASAILIAALGLLLQLFGSGIDRLHRVSDQAHLLIAEKELSARLSTVNFAAKNRDQGSVAGWKYRWQAAQLEPFRPVSADLGGDPDLRHIALFQVDIQILRPQRPDASWRMRALGWRETRVE